jgi:hypothetical protein
MFSCVQDGGKVRYEQAAQSCMQHLGAPGRAEPRNFGFSFMISAFTFIYKAKRITAPFTNMEFISEIPHKECYMPHEMSKFLNTYNILKFLYEHFPTSTNMATRLWGMENREIGVRFPRAANVFLFSN